MPLINVICMTDVCPPTVIAVNDCSDHMSAGGKDATYIAQMFEETIIEFDKEKLCTDIFFFDGASNVQEMAGEVWWQSFQEHMFCMGANMSSHYSFRRLI